MRTIIYSLIGTTILFFATSTASAAPDTVRMEVAGLGVDDGNPSSPFSLPLNTALIPGGQYKILIQGRDTDADNNNQAVNNITFDIAISNGAVNDFEWLVNGDINDADFLNSIPGVDNPGQVSTDTFSGHSFPTQNLINAGFATPLPLAVVYFSAGSVGSINVNLDSNPYVSGFATDNSHYGVNGTSYRINQAQGLAFVTSVSSGTVPTATATRTNTPLPPTATRTNTPVVPTATRTNTPIAPTATRTNTPVPPMPTSTSTATRTSTPLPPTATRTNTPVVPTATRTNTPIAPTATRTNTPIPPMPTSTSTATRTSTPVPPTATRTNTPVPPMPTSTATRTITPTAFIPTATVTPVCTNCTSPTITPTRTITNTQTPVITGTATRTPTPFITGTSTPTRTISPTPTRSPTPAGVYNLRGSVTYNGTALSGVTVSDPILGSRITNTSGIFDFGAVPSGTSYALSLSRSGYVFMPESSCGTVASNLNLSFKSLLANKLYPILECVRNNGNGSYTARYGYHNTGTSVVSASISNNNRFSPNPKDRGQGTVFVPGRTVDYFSSNFSGSSLSWKLKGHSVTAFTGSPACCAAGFIDQCGVCGGDGSSCNSCGQAQGQDVLNALSLLTYEQLDVLNAMKTKSLKEKALSVAVKRRHEAAVEVASENVGILQNLPALLSQCGDDGLCLSASPCELLAKYELNSKKLLAAAQNIARVMKSSRLLKADAEALADKAKALETENSKRLGALSEIQSLCGGE